MDDKNRIPRSDSSDDFSELEKIHHEASVWLARMDRGMGDEDEAIFFEWLAADPAHTEAFEKQRRNWGRLDTLAEWCPEHSDNPNPDLLEPPLPGRHFRFGWKINTIIGVAAVVALMLVFRGFYSISPEEQSAPSFAEIEPEPVELEDGSLLFSKNNSEYKVLYSDRERSIHLLSGEVYFQVAKNPNRPFVVHTRGLRFKAVGTAFNVRVGSNSLELLVEEGIVAMDSSESVESPKYIDINPEESKPKMLEARQRAIVDFERPDSIMNPQVDSLSLSELKRVIAWQHRKLRFDGKPLGEIIEEFNRLNDVQLKLEDEELVHLEITGSIYSNNLKGFTRLLNVGFGIESRADDPYTIVLFDPLQ